jgi:Arc/MetJ-type ribon-helix-helix transcriptional regulator
MPWDARAPFAPMSRPTVLQSIFTIRIPSIEMVGAKMAEEIHRLRERQSDSEKITINVGFVDLGHIDLLVREGFYSNRTDFIRTAIRNQLASHADRVKQSIVRHTFELGLRRVSRQELEASKAKGVRLQIQVVGKNHGAASARKAGGRRARQALASHPVQPAQAI